MIDLLNNLPGLADSFSKFKSRSAVLIESLPNYVKSFSKFTGFPDIANLNLAASQTLTPPTGVTSMRAYVFGKGGDGAIASSGSGGGCAYGDISFNSTSVITCTYVGGVTKLIIDGVDILIANPGATAPGAPGTASIHSSVRNGGAFSGGSGQVTASGGGSSGSPLGNGFAGGSGTNGGGGGWGSVGSSTTAGGFASSGFGAAPSGEGRYNPWEMFTDPLLRRAFCQQPITLNSQSFGQIPPFGVGVSTLPLTNGSSTSFSPLGGGGRQGGAAGLVPNGGGAGSTTAGTLSGGPGALIVFWG
jgi:hypothetical protein